MKRSTAIFAIFDSREEIERAVEMLKNRGFQNSEISILLPSPASNDQLIMEKATKAPEGATTGGIGGFAVGGVFGWLVGIGAITIPGIGPLIAAGPIIAALAGAGVGGSFGVIAGAFIGMGFPEYEARRYEESVVQGGMLLSVHATDDSWKKKAVNTLESCGARDISSTQEKILTTPKEKTTAKHPYQMG